MNTLLLVTSSLHFHRILRGAISSGETRFDPCSTEFSITCPQDPVDIAA